MAIVKGPGMSLQASGNVCGLNYTTWRGLQIVRCAWTGTVPNTAKQLVQQGYLTVVAQAWGSTLTADQRDTYHRSARSIIWKDRFGDDYIPSGYQLYMKLNTRRKAMGLGIMTTAPPKQEFVEVNFLNVESFLESGWIAMNLRVTLGQVISSYGTEYYKAGPYNSGGRRPIEGEWRFLKRKVPPSAYIDTAVSPNLWYWYRGRAISEFGEVQNWFQVQMQFT